MSLLISITFLLLFLQIVHDVAVSLSLSSSFLREHFALRYFLSLHTSIIIDVGPIIILHILGYQAVTFMFFYLYQHFIHSEVSVILSPSLVLHCNLEGFFNVKSSVLCSYFTIISLVFLLIINWISYL